MTPQDIEYLLIEPTTYCNAKCPHCPRYDSQGFLRIQQLDHLMLDAFTNKLDPKKLSNLKVVAFEGDHGDPAMSPNLLDLVSFFNFATVVRVTTNGSIRTPDWWGQMAKIPNLQVIFSIDGLEDTNHIYRVGLEFDRIMKNAQSFIDAGGQAIWKCIIFKHNQHQIEEITKRSEKMGFAQVSFTQAIQSRFQGRNTWPVMVEGKYSHDLGLSDLKQAPHVYNKTHKSLDVLYQPPDKLFWNSDLDSKKLCTWSRKKKFYINFQGHFLPCCMFSDHTHMQTSKTDLLLNMLGGDFDTISLYHHTLEEILQGDFYNHVLEDSLKSDNSMHPTCADQCQKSISTLRLNQSVV